ncbi:MAG: hypothetical protein IPH88_02690 [Bacteroidales bacterium]|nr:hypothetical protein [Bacteroidales bacterium]
MKKTRFILFLLAFFSVSFSYAQWPHTYQAGSNAFGNSLLESYDKGYLIGASTIQYSTNEKYGIVLKTDINGNEIWRKYYTDKFRATYFQRMIQTVDGVLSLKALCLILTLMDLSLS